MGIFGFFPWATKSGDEELHGVTVEITKLLSRELNVPIDIKLQSVARAFRDMAQGHIDMIFAYKDQVMLPNVTFLPTIGCLTPQLFTLKDSPVTSLADAKGKRIGIAEGGHFDTHFGSNSGIEAVTVNSMGSMIKMLLRGRLDGFVANDGALWAYQAHPELSGELLPEQWWTRVEPRISFPQIEVALGLSNASPNLSHMEDIEAAVLRIHEKGDFKRVFEAWGSSTGWDCTHSRPRGNSLYPDTQIVSRYARNYISFVSE